MEKNENVEPREGDEYLQEMANPVAVESRMEIEENIKMVQGGEQIERRPAHLKFEEENEDDEEEEESDEEESEDEIEGPESLASDSENENDDIQDAEEDGKS